ncbi:hypothetical protein FOCC_FOCC000823 [Frankliniella occidentalis]|nr:hypothetical protein FOCC_FOCC000823 [Frankliniella occidentalis]
MSDEDSPPKRKKLPERTRQRKLRKRLHQSQNIEHIKEPAESSAFVDSDDSSSSFELEDAQPSQQTSCSTADSQFGNTSTNVSTDNPEVSNASYIQDEESALDSWSDDNQTAQAQSDLQNTTSNEEDLSQPSCPEQNYSASDPSSPDHSSPESSPSGSSPSDSEESDSDNHENSEESDSDNHDNIFIPAEGILGDNQVQNEIHIREQDDPVCRCTDITVGEVLFMSLSLGFRHVLSFNAIKDYIAMLNTIFKKEVIPATLYNLLKFAEPDRSQDLYHIYCPNCHTYLLGVQEEDLSREISCTCGWQIEKAKSADSFFMSLGMESQLKKLLEKDGIAENLNYRFTRQKINEASLEDVYDGELYKKLSAPGQPLSNPENISFSWNTDGVPYGKTSHQQIYPIYVMINELPPKLRVKNMLMVGIWVGKSKPKMEVLLQPFVNECNQLSSTGFNWHHNGEDIHSLVIPMCCCVDSQERYKLLNHRGFMGYYGCTFCEHPGDHVPKTGIRFGMLDDAPAARTHDTMEQCMLDADREKRVIKGCRGLSPLINLSYFDLAQGPVPDFLHYTENVVCDHLEYILSKISEDDVLRISERALQITTPSAMTRMPRELKFRAKFTANEWRSFLVIYGPAIMRGIVPNKYLSHFALLSYAMHILLQKSISLPQLQFCDKLLILYCIYLDKYFKIGKMTYCVHLLLHVVQGVLNHGPVWTHTCFPFEGKNKEILGWAKSPFRVAKGVARKYFMSKNLPSLASRFDVSDTVLDYCSGLHAKRLWISVRDGNCVTLGRATEYQLLNDEGIALQQLDIGIN